MSTVKTSDTDPIHVDFLDEATLKLPGKIGMTFAPGKKGVSLNFTWDRNLNKDLQRLQQDYGVNLLVSLIEQHEFELIQVPQLLSEAEIREIDVMSFPIADLSTPDSPQTLMPLVEKVLQAARQGKIAILFCRGGLGRTGLVAACCLVALGYGAEQAIAIVRQVRLGSVETQVQQKFVLRYQRALNGATRQSKL